VPDVAIIGAGLAGLACARRLASEGREVVVFEAGDEVGGRVRTDRVDGFLLDRGFQVLLTAYPEVRAQLDLPALRPRAFASGALVRVGERWRRLGDPLREPRTALSTVVAPIGSPADKLRTLRLTSRVRAGRAADLLRGSDLSTREALRQEGFSDRMVRSFFGPLFAGIQLDPELEVSAKRFRIVLRMLATGDAVVPEEGMGQIPRRLAESLPSGSVRLGARVGSVEPGVVRISDGEEVRAPVVVVATDGPEASRLLRGKVRDPGSRPVACVYLRTSEPPLRGPFLALAGEGVGPVTNLAVMSEVSPAYAPSGQALIAAAVPGPAALDDELERLVRHQLRGWFSDAEGWEIVRTYRIPHGHPDQRPGFSPKQHVALGEGLYVCGDHRDTASIQGALFSGRRTAEEVLARRG
jgi:phytoene dehydrogenase-like protein